MKQPSNRSEYQRRWAAAKRATDPIYRERQRAANRRYFERHRAEALAVSRDWKAKNKERVREYRKEYWKKHKTQEYSVNRQWILAHPERAREYQKADRQKNAARRRANPSRKATRNASERRRYAADPTYRVEKRIRACLWQALRRVKANRSDTLRDVIGCSIPDLRSLLEQRFLPGMSWSKDVHIDHIRPVAAFDLRDPAQLRACFHFSNLQPLWAVDNRLKQDKILT